MEMRRNGATSGRGQNRFGGRIGLGGKFAILIDGGFIKKKLQARNKHFPTVSEIDAEVVRVKSHALLANSELLRIYFYDAPPISGLMRNPVDGIQNRLGEEQTLL